jgi:hypothetical protein
MVIEADEPTAVAIERAALGECCSACGRPAQIRVVVTRMDMAHPATLAYCRPHMGAGVDGLVDELAARRRRRQSLN